MFFTSSYLKPMDNESILRKAPAVFAERPHSQTSYGKDSDNAYLFIPTIKVIDGLRNNGWSVVSAAQTMNKASSSENLLTNKHAVFFARTDSLGQFGYNDVMPMVKLENSHNGLSSFAISTGFFRKVCANGLTVPKEIYAAPKVRHTMNLRDEVIEATYKVLNDFPQLIEMHRSLSGLELTQDERFLLADAAADIFFEREERTNLNHYAKRYGHDRYLLESQLITPRRYDDRKTDLWTVSNVVQENLIRGNVRTVGTDGRLKSKRKVTSIDRDNDIHEKLFMLTQKFAELKGLKIGAVA